MMYDIVVLAGGKPEKELRHLSPLTKAYIPLGSRLMVEYVLESARTFAGAGKIILASPSEDLPEPVRSKADLFSLSGDSIVDSLAGAIALSDAEYLLVIPCDIPLITKESADDFLMQCQKRKASVYYSYISRMTSETRYPDLPHTYARLKEGIFCGGSLVLLRKEDFEKGEHLFRSLTASRKNVLKLALKLGFVTLLKFLTHTITVDELERVGGRILNLDVAAIRSSYAEIAFNVDDLAALNIAKSILNLSD